MSDEKARAVISGEIDLIPIIKAVQASMGYGDMAMVAESVATALEQFAVVLRGANMTGSDDALQGGEAMRSEAISAAIDEAKKVLAKMPRTLASALSRLNSVKHPAERVC